MYPEEVEEAPVFTVVAVTAISKQLILLIDKLFSMLTIFFVLPIFTSILILPFPCQQI